MQKHEHNNCLATSTNLALLSQIYLYKTLLASQSALLMFPLHSKKCWVIQPKFGSNMDKPKFWVKNVI